MKHIFTISLCFLALSLSVYGQDNYSMSFSESTCASINIDAISSDNFSCNAWMRSEYEHNGYVIMHGNDGWLDDFGFAFQINNGYLELNVNATNVGNSTTYVTDGQWHFISFVFNNGVAKLFIDGNLEISSFSFSSLNNTLWPLIIGSKTSVSCSSNDGSGTVFDGEVDHIHIWNTALTQEQIQQYMNCPPSGDEEGLVGYWNFEEGEGETVFDLSGNGNHGEVYGATWSTDTPEQNCLGDCQDSVACNFNSNADYDDGSCEYFTCKCLNGTVWSDELEGCIVENPTDTNLDGCTNLTDLMDILSAYGDCGICQDDYMLTFSGGNTGTCCCTGGNSGNSYILADVSPNLSNASTATVEFWLHLDTYTQYGTILWSEGTGDSGLGVTNASDCGYDSNHRYKTSLFWGGADILSLSTASLGAWQHYALVFDNGTVSYFVDGVLQGTTSSSSSTTPNIPNDWLYFGGKLPYSNGNNQHQVNGSYRSIRVSSTARYSSNFTPEDTLLADSETMHLYSLDEGTGYTVYDSVDSTMTGTIVNGINANETWSLFDTCP